MTEAVKKLGAAMPTANTLQTLYSVPAARSAVISSIVICNQSSRNALFRLSHAVAGAADTRAQYQYYDQFIPPKQTFIATIGMTAGASDVIRAQSDNSETSFTAYGSELT